MFRRFFVGVGLAGVFVAGPVAAQQFDIGPRLGYASFKEESGLRAAAILGLDAVYHISSRLGVGVQFDVSRPNTESRFFPAEMSFGDTTLIFAVNQPVTVVHYGVLAQFETGGSLSVFAKGGVGGYNITANPETARGRATLSELAYSAGAGVRLRTGTGTSIRLEVQDLVFINFERNALNPVEPRFRPVRFPDVVPLEPEFDGTAHNLLFAIAFTFTPGGAR